MQKRELGEVTDLVDLTTRHDVKGEWDVVSFEVSLHLATVVICDDLVGDKEASSPLLVDVCQVIVLDIEDIVDKLEAWRSSSKVGWNRVSSMVCCRPLHISLRTILELLVSVDAEAVSQGSYSSSQITHVEMKCF